MSGRRLARWCTLAIAAGLVLVGLDLAVLLAPYPLFPHHAARAGFSVYCDSELPEGFGLALDDARGRADAMPLFRGRLPRVFVCRSQRLFEVLVRLAGKRHAGQGLLISAAGNMFLSEPGVLAVAGRSGARPTGSRLEGSWSHAIAHEVAHQLMADELGFWRAREVPPWKAEGYADYSAAIAPLREDADGNLGARIALLVDDRAWHGRTAAIDRRHFRWQLQVEYLCTIRGLAFKDLLAPDITDESTHREMLQWWEGQRPARAAPGDAVTGT